MTTPTSARWTSRTSSSDIEALYAFEHVECPTRLVTKLSTVISEVHAAVPVDGRGRLRLWVERVADGSSLFISPQDIVLDVRFTTADFAHEYGHFVDAALRLRHKWWRLVRSAPEVSAWSKNEYLSHRSEMLARFFEQVAAPHDVQHGYSRATYQRLLPHFARMVS